MVGTGIKFNWIKPDSPAFGCLLNLNPHCTEYLLNRSKMATSGGAVKVEDFERKLAETDSYLQLLLNQVNL